MAKNWPEYQASFFFNGSKDDQLVVRSDDKKEFDEMLKWVREVKKAAKNNNNGNNLVSKENNLCPIHGVPMKQRNGRDGGVFYSHAKQIDRKWVYCKGKGWGK